MSKNMTQDLVNLRKELFHIKIKHSFGDIRNISLFKQTKRSIASMITSIQS